MKVKTTLAAITRNKISLAGSVIIQVSVILLITLFVIEFLGFSGNPYIGMITYMALPALMLLGVALIVWGVKRERKRVPEVDFPIIDLNQEQTRKRLMWMVFFVTLGGIAVIVGGSSAVHYMESDAFCGQVCHIPMTPEFTAHSRSPHSRVKCTQCHVGEGADWFVKSKLSGARQLITTVINTYHRPIPTPVHGLRPSEGTCETCHWPAQFHGSTAKVITRFSEDEANTETKTILLMHVGGHDFAESRGIHWHSDDDIQIRYRANPSRSTIYEVELTLEDGSITRYTSRSDKPAAGEKTEWRLMDCIDCHNRPTHIYLGPDEAIDLALEREFIASDLPYIKREGMSAVTQEYQSHEDAEAGILAAIGAFYGEEYPELATGREADINEASAVLGELYKANVYPNMNLGWDQYPNHLGHESSPGCFRCHGGDHETEDGETLSFDCRPCHMVVAWDEASPQILELLKE